MAILTGLKSVGYKRGFCKMCETDKFLQFAENQTVNLLITFLAYMLLMLFCAFLIAFRKPCALLTFTIALIWNDSI